MCPADLLISVATLEDAPVLADLGARTFRDTFGSDNSESDMAAYLAQSFSPEIQSRELQDAATTFLIASIAGNPAGYAKLRIGHTPSRIAAASAIEIVRFYADAPWIGRGVGAALMDACLQYASRTGCDVVWLDVWERNARAIAFYERWGFRVVGEQAFVLGEDVQHDLLMARAAASQRNPADGER
jgi:ribosomal protein S18 acetylase RimI-like enzyme